MTTNQLIKKIGRIDLLIVIPSKNTAHGIKTPTQAAYAGAAKFFPKLKTAIINLDSNSKDGTPKVFSDAIRDLDKDIALISSHKNIFTASLNVADGKGTALREGFYIARKTQAKCFVTVDADLRSITPEWIERLAKPVLDHKIDFVAPFYVRHKYNATITNSLIYPLTRVIYKKELRQPIGGEFAMSPKIINKLLELEPWPNMAYLFGIDIFITTTALRYSKNIAEAFLGVKNHDPKDPGLHLGPMFEEVVSTLFSQMKTHAKYWEGLRENKITKVPRFGLPFAVVAEPVPVNPGSLVKLFRQGFIKNKEVYRKYFTAGVFKALESASNSKSTKFGIDLWADLVFEGAKSDMPPSLMIPLYYGRTATFVKETKNLSQDQGEVYIKDLAKRFEKDSSYLYSFWLK